MSLTNAQYATLVASAKTSFDSAVTAFSGSATNANAGLLSIAAAVYGHSLMQYARNLDIPNASVNVNAQLAANSVGRTQQALADAQAASAAAPNDAALRNAVDIAVTNLKIAEVGLVRVNSISASPVQGL